MSDPTLVTTDPVPGVDTYLWSSVSESDTPTAAKPGSYSSLASSVQVVGTFGGTTVTFQGSNDNTNWVDLKDINGTAISFAAAGMAQLNEACKYFKPKLTGGSSVSVNVYFTTRS